MRQTLDASAEGNLGQCRPEGGEWGAGRVATDVKSDVTTRRKVLGHEGLRDCVVRVLRPGQMLVRDLE